MVGCKVHDMTQPVAVLWKKSNVAPVCAVPAERGVRAVKKLPGMKTWIRTLWVSTIIRVGDKHGSSSRRWLKTLENRHQLVANGEGDGDAYGRGRPISVVGVRYRAEYERTKRCGKRHRYHIWTVSI